MTSINNALLRNIVSVHNEQTSLDFNFLDHSVFDGAVFLAKILLRTNDSDGVLVFESLHKTPFDLWYDSLPYRQQRMVSNWLQNCLQTNDFYFFKKFNERHEIREIFELFLYHKPAPPYWNYLCLNLIKQIFHLSNDEMAAITARKDILYTWYDKLISHKDKIETWRVENAAKVRYYGGNTNTVLGFYKYVGEKWPNQKNYDAHFDLGGGYATSDIIRLFNRPFVSLDVSSPFFRDNGEDLIIRKIDGPNCVRCLNDREMSCFREEQSLVKWIHTDIAQDQIPVAHDSYFVTSFGFITSTVKLSKQLEQLWCSEIIEPDYRTVVTSLVGMYRIIELVNTGKHVQLISVNRSSTRSYTYGAVLLEWKNGKIINFQATLTSRSRTKRMRLFHKILSQ